MPFKDKEQSKTYIRGYMRRRRAEKKLKADPIDKFIDSLQTDFNKWLQKIEKSEDVLGIVYSDKEQLRAIFKVLERESAEKLRIYNSEVPKTSAPESIKLLIEVQELRKSMNYLEMQIQVLRTLEYVIIKEREKIMEEKINE